MKQIVDLVIRPVSPGDLDAVCNLPATRREAFWIFPAHSYPVRPAELSRNLKSRLDPIVALVDDEVAGFANLYRVVEGESCFVGNLSVSVRRRRMGLATVILADLARRARAAYGVKTVHLSCFSDNLQALFCYHGLGFEPYAMEPRLDWDHQPVALIHMKRDALALERMAGGDGSFRSSD